MSIFKKFVAPLLAVALVAVMGVSLLANTGTAHAAAITAGQGVVGGGSLGTSTSKIWSGTGLATKGLIGTAPTITETGVTWATADTITLTHAGYTLSGVTATMSVQGTVVAVGGAGSTVLTITTTDVIASNQVISLSAANIALTAVSTDAVAIAAIAPGAGTTLNLGVTALTTGRMLLGFQTTSTTFSAPLDMATPSLSADTTATGGVLCALVADAAGAPVVTLPVTFTVSLGVVSTGSAKTVAALTASNGSACTNYRGGGGIAATDTAIASNSGSAIVSTLAITVTAPAGGTATKMVITAPSNMAVSASVTNTSPAYVSPTQQTNVAVQVQDAAGVGVSSQVVLITVDKGFIVAGFNATACGAAKAVTSTSTSQALTSGGTAVPGGISLTYCANQLDASGSATMTVSNITTSMANVTSTIATAGRPAKVAATYANGVVSAVVTDANGNKVADGTQVQFTISSTAGAVSNACTTTSSGASSSAVSLNSGSGTVIVTASWNESGALAAGCVAANAVAQGGNAGAVGSIGTSLNGAQGTSSTVNIGSVVTPPPSTPVTGAGGGFAAAPVYSASKLAQSVFNGGSLVQLEAAVTGGGGTGVWAQDSKGVFLLDIIGGGFVNDAFKAAFPTGFSGVTAVTVVGK